MGHSVDFSFLQISMRGNKELGIQNLLESYKILLDYHSEKLRLSELFLFFHLSNMKMKIHP